jgi:hypothetical protein
MLTHVMSRGCIANRASFLYPLPNPGLRYCSRCLLTVYTISNAQRNSGLYATFRKLLPPGQSDCCYNTKRILCVAIKATDYGMLIKLHFTHCTIFVFCTQTEQLIYLSGPTQVCPFSAPSTSDCSSACPQKIKSESLSGFLTFDIDECCCSPLTLDTVNEYLQASVLYVDSDVQLFLSAP